MKRTLALVACALLPACARRAEPPPGSPGLPSPDAVAALKARQDALNSAVRAIATLQKLRVQPQALSGSPTLPDHLALAYLGRETRPTPPPRSGLAPDCPPPSASLPAPLPDAPDPVTHYVSIDEALRRERDSLDFQIAELDAMIPRRFDADLLRQELRCAAERSDVELTAVTPGSPLASAVPDVLEVTVTADAIGSREALDAFFGRLTHWPRILVLDELRPEALSDGHVTVHCRLRAFVMPRR